MGSSRREGACGGGEGTAGSGGGDAGRLKLSGCARAGECTCDHDAALLAGGHLTHWFVSKVFCADLMEEIFGSGPHRVRDDEIWPEGGGGEEAGEDGVEAGGVEGGLAGELGGDDTEALPKLGEIPTPAAEDADRGGVSGGGLGERVELAGDGLQEGGFSAAVGAEDGEVLPCGEGEVHIVENGHGAARDKDVFEGKYGSGHAAFTG